MAYEKQNFANGEILRAEQLEKMEEGIINAENLANANVGGSAGVYAGAEPPDDQNVLIWIDTDDDGVADGVICSYGNGVRIIDAGLTYARGIVEVRKIGDVLWFRDSGVYNFTESFTAAKNRTVLEFDLPKTISDKIPNANGAYGTTGTIMYFPALAYENVTYTTFNCQSYIKRSAIGTDYDTYQIVYTGIESVSGGGLCGFHLTVPILLVGGA